MKQNKKILVNKLTFGDISSLLATAIGCGSSATSIEREKFCLKVYSKYIYFHYRSIHLELFSFLVSSKTFIFFLDMKQAH